MPDFVMPALGADMEAGTLVAWKKQPGDRVARGDIIAEVETDKAVVEVEVFTSGVIEALLVRPGEKVPVGTPLARIRAEGEPATPGEADAGARGGGGAATAPSPRPQVPPSAPRPKISPAARKLAAALGVDPASVTGTGPDGSVTSEDVQRAAAPPAPAPAAGEARAVPADPQARMRQAIAAAMARSKREIPHYYLATTVELGRLTAWLAEENRRRPMPARLLPAVLFLKATALALREVPELNGFWKDGRAVPSEAIHLGAAVSLRQGGLVAPALHDADRLSLDELMRGLRDLVTRARAGSLRSSELADPTITVTNLGDLGVETAFGVIYPPQVALVGIGKVVERPWVADGVVVPRPVVTITLSADHRATDGRRGGVFLAALDRLLQEPERL
jgi:pyruvate dehydrogenase E2 component (dihydrolipoamide acetyltransferase)